MSDSSQTAAADELGLGLSEDTSQFLTFLLGNEEYAINILAVQEVRGWDGATPMPNTPKYIRGVINLRGEIVPIIDLRDRFGLPVREYDETTVVIVLGVELGERMRTVGVVVDGVSEVYNVAEEDVQAAPRDAGAIGDEFVRGLTTVDEQLIIVLSVEELVAAIIAQGRRQRRDTEEDTAAEQN